MATDNIYIHPSSSNAVYRDERSALYPVRKDTITIIHRYIVGTDFTSGYGLLIMLYGCQKILTAIAKTPSNTFLALTEANITTVGGMGKTIETGVSSTDIEVYITYEV